MYALRQEKNVTLGRGRGDSQSWNQSWWGVSWILKEQEGWLQVLDGWIMLI